MTYEPSFYTKLDDDPGALGLTFLAEVGVEGLSYEYDFTRAWADAAGAVYLAHTAGCSCGAPFDEFSSLGDLIPVDTGTLPWLAALKAGDECRPYDVNEERWQAFVSMLRGHLLGRSNKRFDAAAYAVKKAEEEAYAIAAQILANRRDATMNAMRTVAERAGIKTVVDSWRDKAAFDYVHAAQQFDVEMVLLIGATLHAMAFTQMEATVPSA